MGKYFHIVDKEVLDWKFTRHPQSGAVWYNFYLGDVLVGIVCKDKACSWSTISWTYPDPLGVIDGFSSRHRAAEYLLKVFDKQRLEYE